MSNEFKIGLISEAIVQRENEIAMYEINIFNYESATEADDGSDPETAPFVANLRNLLVSEKAEKKKVEMILAALRKQLAVLQAA